MHTRISSLYVDCLRDCCSYHRIKNGMPPFTKRELLLIYPRWLCLQMGNNLCLEIQGAQ